MSTTTRPSEKGTDHSSTDPDDRALIDAATIRRLEDAEPDAEGCRFAAVARSLETVSPPNTTFSIPATVVAYVDESGEYAVEREYLGHRPEWDAIPRTIVVTADSPVRSIPEAHTERYAPVLETYAQILAEE